MKSIFFYFFILLVLIVPVQEGRCDVPDSERYTVYLFLGEECIISQQYTLLLKRLHSEYANSELNFIGLFPNPSSNLEKMAKFQEQYALPFELKLDPLQHKMDEFQVKVTPEVVVFDRLKIEVLYQGRIDNTFFRVGKKRTITTTSELEDVLVSIKEKQPIVSPKTIAVGCFITPLDSNLKNAPMCKEGDSN